MITIEGQEFYNFAEALLYLFETVENDLYTKEEVDGMIAAINVRINSLPAPLTAEQVREIVDEELGVIVNGRF